MDFEACSLEAGLHHGGEPLIHEHVLEPEGEIVGGYWMAIGPLVPGTQGDGQGARPVAVLGLLGEIGQRQQQLWADAVRSLGHVEQLFAGVEEFGCAAVLADSVDSLDDDRVVGETLLHGRQFAGGHLLVEDGRLVEGIETELGGGARRTEPALGPRLPGDVAIVLCGTALVRVGVERRAIFDGNLELSVLIHLCASRQQEQAGNDGEGEATYQQDKREGKVLDPSSSHEWQKDGSGAKPGMTGVRKVHSFIRSCSSFHPEKYFNALEFAASSGNSFAHSLFPHTPEYPCSRGLPAVSAATAGPYDGGPASRALPRFALPRLSVRWR